MKLAYLICFGAFLAAPGWSQQGDEDRPRELSSTEQRKGSGATHDIGSGAGNIGVGAAKGAGAAAKGAGKGAVDLATLHPISAAGEVGKGAVSAGKDVTVGTAKGSGKIARGVGKAFKKIF